jgi:hypothetical protein
MRLTVLITVREGEIEQDDRALEHLMTDPHATRSPSHHFRRM